MMILVKPPEFYRILLSAGGGSYQVLCAGGLNKGAWRIWHNVKTSNYHIFIFR